ncbi:hypothetical protein [Pseudokineococcus sp. 1T1Z-3]|uniref:hypothetical protein n=1 Tax=Pseudokineococcus sp. 1T1Z-3 TaxID=3132745 RepID=UPI003096EC57
MTRPSTRRSLPTTLLLGALLLGACAGGGRTGVDGQGAGTDDGSSPPPSASQPSAGATASGEPTGTLEVQARESDLDVGAPSGWRTWEVADLVMAVPAEWEPSYDRGLPGSSVTFLPPQSSDDETLGAVAVFVENSALGPLALRTRLAEEVRTDQVGTGPAVPVEERDVPGALGATLLTYEYEQEVQPTGRTYESVSGDVLLQTEENPQYSISASGATQVWDLDDLQAFVGTLELRRSGAGA